MRLYSATDAQEYAEQLEKDAKILRMLFQADTLEEWSKLALENRDTSENHSNIFAVERDRIRRQVNRRRKLEGT